MNDLTPQEIEQQLLELPNKIWKFGQEFIAAETVYRKAEESASAEFDVIFLKIKANNPEKTIKEIETEARSASYVSRLNAIESEAAYKSAKLKMEACRDKLGALQSIVKLKVAEISSMNA